MKQVIERVRALANDALAQYSDEIKDGSETAYPAWADDVLAVCKLAEQAAQS